ncbi:berberine and berberine like family protein (plasmid) [Ochrobactrum quorumnocens]|uniref:Berberine and berberine like family protein n=1 Tax=Ochrobactrum quorumnocens TaxID=271865 RepID=A0A248UNR1_9HYPH|nr:berberine and berberine like family protein [[Ochrobactrum] quorumnocens]
MRELFYAVHAKDGVNGTPYPDVSSRYEGCYINYPDVDMIKGQQPNAPKYNWMELYYPGIYKDLIKAKGLWDPNNIFHHQMSIPLPELPKSD